MSPYSCQHHYFVSSPQSQGIFTFVMISVEWEGVNYACFRPEQYFLCQTRSFNLLFIQSFIKISFSVIFQNYFLLFLVHSWEINSINSLLNFEILVIPRTFFFLLSWNSSRMSLDLFKRDTGRHLSRLGMSRITFSWLCAFHLASALILFTWPLWKTY